MARSITFCYCLWSDPLVYVVSTGSTLVSGVNIALLRAEGRPCYILARPSWMMDAAILGLTAVAHWLSENYPKVRLVTMASSERDRDLAQSRGVAAIWAHNGAFIDEHIFYPMLGEPKLYRALLNSQSREFKRHDLAFNVKNLAWITYNEVGIADRIGELVAQYRYLDYVNYSQETGSVLLDGAQLRRILNRARCGLALSGEEGPNNASMEYFLCGLPLVTTPAKGGREEMYDPRHVRIVAPEPDAVEHAVAYFCAHPIDPMEIRASALRKAMPHRARLIEWLSGVASRDLLAESGDNYWLPQFCDKFRQTWEIDEQDDGSWTADPIHGWALPTLLGEVPPFTAVNSASASDTALGRRSPD